MLNRVKSTEFCIGVFAIALALCLCFLAPARLAHASEVTRIIDSSLTVTLQEASNDFDSDNATSDDSTKVKAIKPVSLSEKGGGLPATGEEMWLAMLGLLILGTGAVYCLFQSSKVNSFCRANTKDKSEEGSFAQADNIGMKRKVIAVTLASVLLSSSCFFCFSAKTSAFAEAFNEIIKTSSTVVVDTEGNVLSASITVRNEMDRQVSVNEVIAPVKLAGWEASFENETIEPNASISGAWSGVKISSDVMTEVIANGNVTLQFLLKVDYDNTEITDENGKAQVFDMKNNTDQVITITDEKGNPVQGAVVEIDKEGKTDIQLPEESEDKNIVISKQNEDGVPDVGKKMEVSDNNGTSRGEGTTDSEGKVKYVNITTESFSLEEAVYNGEQQTPTVSSSVLKEGIDFQVVSWGTNIDAGAKAGSVVIKGIGTCKGEKTVSFDIHKRKVTVNGIHVNNREYDGTEDASFDLSDVVVSNKAKETDDVYVSAVSGQFVDSVAGAGDAKDKGTNKKVEISEVTLAGSALNNYELDYTNSEKDAFASISPKVVRLLWPATVKFEYNGESQGISPTVDEEDLCGNDSTPTVSTVFLKGTSQVTEHKNAGTYVAQAVSLSDENYALPTTNTSNEFTITKKPVTINGAAVISKTYDGNQDAQIDITNAIASGYVNSDDVRLTSASGSFDTKHAGDSKSVTLTALDFSGDDAENYVLSSEQVNLTGRITQKTVTVGGVSVKDRAYADNDRSVELQGVPAFAEGDICEGDIVQISSCTALDYADANAENNKDVTLAIELGGEDAGNYVVSDASKTKIGNILAVVKFDTNCATTIANVSVKVGEKIADTFTDQLPTRAGLTKEGWYNNAACSSDLANEKFKWDFSANTVSGNVTTLYANWSPTDGDANGNLSYWISPSYKVTTANTEDDANQGNNAADNGFARDSYVSEEWNVLKSSTEIQADIERMDEELTSGTAGADGSVTNEYKSLMQGDKYHLYVKYPGGATEGDHDGETSVLNDYVEFRIIEAGEHLNEEDKAESSDGSLLTFMATHALPTGEQMNTSGTNSGGWNSTAMRARLQKGGTIYDRFSTSFTNDILVINKLNNKGGGASQTEMGKTTSDAFWLLSYSEIKATGTASSSLPLNEGTAYQWFKDMVINVGDQNPAISFTTRAGKTPGSQDHSKCQVWGRSPGVGGFYNYAFFDLFYHGYPSSSYADNRFGVVPCFAFGVPMSEVTFDTNAPSGTTATLDGDSAKTAKIKKGETLSTDYIPNDSEITCSDSTYTFVGWAESAESMANEALRKDELASKSVSVGENKHYYAIWAKNDFWLSTTNSSGTTLADFVGDANFCSSTDIINDITVLREGTTNTSYTQTFSRWNTYYANDVKLYSTYVGGASETLYGGGTSTLNGLVEFRILEVSGEAGHMNTSGDSSSSDGSVVTFMATHLLPTAEQANALQDNTGGWSETALRKKLQSGGEIYNKFPTALTTNIHSPLKLNNAAGGASATTAGTMTEDPFWLLSYSELYTTGTYCSYAPYNEGTPYKWCQDKVINGKNANAVLKYKTRSGAIPGSPSAGTGDYWWQRSPRHSTIYSFMTVTPAGSIHDCYTPDTVRGVVPCFCF